MGLVVNFPVPRMLLMVLAGCVDALLSENPLPSSVPASHGKRSTTWDWRHCPCSLSKDSPETPVNQSGLGPIFVNSVIRGW